MSGQKKIIVEPMHTMLNRYREIEKDYPAKYTKPQVTLGRIEATAQAVADWDLSDPFAYGRAALYVRQGYIEPEQTIKDYHMRTVARRAARVKEVEDEKHA